MKKSYYTILARKLRQEQTDVEKILWFQLRNRQLNSVKFKRQQRIGQYIVDFVTLEKKIIIELDGGQHNTETGKTLDAERTKWLESEGYQVIQFWNNDVTENLENVLETIMNALTLALSPNGRGNFSPESSKTRMGNK
jgi:very-short-patch-repair endonuclease